MVTLERAVSGGLPLGIDLCRVWVRGSRGVLSDACAGCSLARARRSLQQAELGDSGVSIST